VPSVTTRRTTTFHRHTYIHVTYLPTGYGPLPLTKRALILIYKVVKRNYSIESVTFSPWFEAHNGGQPNFYCPAIFSSRTSPRIRLAYAMAPVRTKGKGRMESIEEDIRGPDTPEITGEDTPRSPSDAPKYSCTV
jgi:hypothetical protein